MGVYYKLAYGIALTDQFGGQLKEIPEALFDFGHETEENESLDVIQSIPTEEDRFLVLGVPVKEGSKNGETWISGTDTLKEIHEQYLKTLRMCPAEVQKLVEDGGLIPRLCVLAGNF